MSVDPSPTADVPIPDEHIADVAAQHDVDEAELREALAATYAYMADGADAIHERYAADDATPDATETADGLASVIHVASDTWNEAVVDLSAALRDAVRDVHARFTDGLEGPAETPADREPLVLPSARIGELVRVGLSRRQAQVQVLDDAGLSTAEIAGRLGVAESTVNVHRHRIATKVEEAEELLALTGE